MLDTSNRLTARAKKVLTSEQVEMIDSWESDDTTKGWYKFQAVSQVYSSEILRKSNEDIAKSNSDYAKVMSRLTLALVFVGAIQILIQIPWSTLLTWMGMR